MASQSPPEWLSEEWSVLSNDSIGKAAVNGQLVAYPKVVRTQTDPPIPNQTLCNTSFMLFAEPKKLKSGKLLYGFVKNRGNWPDEMSARRSATNIIKEVDSRFQIRMAPVGSWLPITDDDGFVQELIDVKMSDDEKHLRDEAAKEKQSKDRQIMRELREREEEVKSGGDIYDDPTSLKYYSMRRVTEIRLIETRERHVKELKELAGTLKRVMTETKTLERSHPEYLEEWLECYNVERRKSGIPDYIPGEDHIREHDVFSLDSDASSSSSGASSSTEA
jgi:hypothetical protein